MTGEKPMTQPGSKCSDFGGRRKDGKPCGGQVVTGTRRCAKHAGMTLAKAKAKGAVVTEIRSWGLGDVTVDPGEVLLRLVTQAAARCALYAQLLEDAYQAADRLREAHAAHRLVADLQDPDDPETVDPPSVQAAKEDLDRIFNVGGIAALVGNTYSDTKTGAVYATGEQIRGLAKLEADERDRCAGFATKAVAAGLAERQVRLAERQATQLVQIMHAVVAQLGHNPADPAVQAAITGQLRVIAGGKAA